MHFELFFEVSAKISVATLTESTIYSVAKNARFMTELIFRTAPLSAIFFAT
jgi:hypothetical protein